MKGRPFRKAGAAVVRGSSIEKALGRQGAELRRAMVLRQKAQDFCRQTGMPKC